MPKPIVIFPYLHANRGRVLDEIPWITKSGIVNRTGRVVLPSWDCTTPLILNRRVKVDWVSIADDCALSDKDNVQVIVTWACTTGGTGLKGRCYRGKPLNIGDVKSLLKANITTDQQASVASIDIEAKFDGTELAGLLVLRTQLLLYSSGKGIQSFSPKIAGSVLWEDQFEVVLDSGGERFPVELVDFAASLAFPKNAAWRLDWYRGDLSQPLLGGMCLRINSQNAIIKKAVTGSAQDIQDEITRNVIKYDVARTMLHGVLVDEDFLELAKQGLYEEGSIGKTIQRLASSLFPNDSLESLSELIKSKSEEFDARLQGSLRFLDSDVIAEKQKG
jgi:hypothetical protein